MVCPSIISIHTIESMGHITLFSRERISPAMYDGRLSLVL